MALLEILVYPDKRLREVAEPVSTIDSDTQRLLDDMFETMYDAPGIGLAATQVGVMQRIVVIDTSENKDSPMVLINPEILSAGTTVKQHEEGCLSIPEVFELVDRPDEIRFKALNRDGERNI